ELGVRKCASTILHSLNDTIEILKVFPHEPSNARILWNCFVRSVGELISTAWAFYRNVVDVRDRDMRDFVLKDVGNVVVKDRYGIGPTHREGDESLCSERCLEGGEIAG